MLEETYASVIDVVFPDSPDSQNVLLAEETCTFYIERYTTGRGRVTLIDTLGNTQNDAFKEILVFNQFKCADFKSEIIFSL